MDAGGPRPRTNELIGRRPTGRVVIVRPVNPGGRDVPGPSKARGEEALRRVARFHRRAEGLGIIKGAHVRDASPDPPAAVTLAKEAAERRDESNARVSVVPQLVEHLGYAVMCRLAASQHFIKWINVEREAVSLKFAKKLQEEADEHRLGIEIVYAGIPSVHPPAEVADAFEKVIGAFETMHITINKAEGTKTSMINKAAGEAAVLTNEAKAYKASLEGLAEPAKERFRNQLRAYKKAPRVYRFRKYFAMMEEVLKDHKIYVVPFSTDEVQIFDLKDQLSPDIIGLDVKKEIEK